MRNRGVKRSNRGQSGCLGQPDRLLGRLHTVIARKSGERLQVTSRYSTIGTEISIARPTSGEGTRQADKQRLLLPRAVWISETYKAAWHI